MFTIKIFTRKTAAGGWWRRRRRWGKSAACAEKTYECINTAAAAQQQQQPAPRRRKARTVYSGPSSAERATDSATVFSWHIISKHSAKTENIVKLNWRISKGSKIEQDGSSQSETSLVYEKKNPEICSLFRVLQLDLCCLQWRLQESYIIIVPRMKLITNKLKLFRCESKCFSFLSGSTKSLFLFSILKSPKVLDATAGKIM